MSICKTCGKIISAYCPDCRRMRKMEGATANAFDDATPGNFMKEMGIMGW